MPETPIRTGTDLHHFDAAELDSIRSAVATWDDPGGYLTVIDLDFARTVMPAMAEKIEQLRDLYQQAEARAEDLDLERRHG
jgi:hypothetical protein